MSNWNPEISFDLFRQKRPLIESARTSNEATVRLRSINTLLFEVLGWDQLTVDVEKYCREVGFADYAFREKDSICLLLEAKKGGATFVLPDQKFSDRPIGFPLLAQECPDAEKALRQALGYAASEGARYIAISNGHQWLLTLTFVQNQSLADRSVFVFESLDAIQRRWRGFWDCFSPAAIYSNRPANALLESRKAPAPHKLSHNITNYPVPATRNVIANELSAVTGLVLDEVRHDENIVDFLHECYVEPEANQSSIMQATELLQQRLSTDEKVYSETVSPDQVPQLLTYYSVEKPIVVLGKVGHGKTTFLKYLRNIKAKAVLDKYIQLSVDFIDRPDGAAQVGSFIYGEIERQLREHYDVDLTKDNIVRGVLHFDIERFRDSPEGKLYARGSAEFRREEVEFIKKLRADPHVYLGKAFQHIRAGRTTSIAVFLDNLDRRSDAIQEEAFLRASAMARDWAGLVFVCLRPGTYYRSKSFGVLDSVAPKIINVASPKTKLLVTRRLTYAKKIADGISQNTRTHTRAPFAVEVTYQLPTCAQLLDACIGSFASNRKFSDLFDAVSNGNARDLLAYVSKFLTSKHLDTSKIVEKWRNGGYVVPEHEAIRALLYLDTMQYDPSSSAFINLFDIERADPLEHFSRYLALHHVLNVPDRHPSYGYVHVRELIRYLCQLGYSEEHSLTTTSILFNAQYLDSKMPSDEWSDDIEELKITSKGKYHITSLVNTFTYMDAITVDTPILDDLTRADIRDVLGVMERLERCSNFLQYLHNCSMGLQDAQASQLWNETYTAVRNNISVVTSAATGHRH